MRFACYFYFYFYFSFLSVHALLPHGFFGMIGPHVKTASSLYQLFTSNGILQGVFINGSALTPVSHVIQTEKVLFEAKWGPLSSNIHHLPFQMALSKLGLFPHMGTANTAVLSVRDQDYALFERDLPYHIQIDMATQSVRTVAKCALPGLHGVSAHSWFDTHIHSHAYSILHQSVSFMVLTETFQPLRVETFRTRYVPLIHSHLRVRDHYLFTDSPLFFSWKRFFQAEFPFHAKPRPTYIHVTPDVYTFQEPFFIFHYASLEETPDAFILYAPLYETLDFSTTTMYGKYRRLILHKENKTITMDKNAVLETYNLDFPVRWRHMTLLRNLDLSTQKINGFILCDGLTIVKEFWVSLGILGEPCVENDSILFFAYNQTGTFLVEVCLLSGTQQDHWVELPGTLGFHSFFKKKY